LVERIMVQSPATAIRRELELLDAITDLWIRLGGPVDRIVVVEKKSFI
jgi:hypothetical protein